MSNRRRIKEHRKIYEDWYGITIPEGFDIHHIDFDRDNNSPDNLLMLPAELHHRYHQAVLLMFGAHEECVIKPQLTPAHRHQFEFLPQFAGVLEECAEWISKREMARSALLWRAETERFTEVR
jgi:hypothetical protein